MYVTYRTHALDRMLNGSSDRLFASISSRKPKSGLNKQQTRGTQSKAASGGPVVTGGLRHTNSNSDSVLNLHHNKDTCSNPYQQYYRMPPPPPPTPPRTRSRHTVHISIP